MDDPNELYRQTKIAQRQAERGGFINTATALAAIAEMLVLEAGVDAAMILRFSGDGPAPFPAALPIHRQTRH